MQNTWAIAKKELRSHFYSPTAYIYLVVFLLFTGYFFAQPLFLINQAGLEHFLEVVPLLLVFFVPAVTMRAITEELKTGTMETLMTLPIQEHEILFGKYLAALLLTTAAIAATIPYPLAVALLGDLDVGAAAGAYLGLWLLAASFTALGICSSTGTRNQIVAFILGLLIAFTLFLFGKIQALLPPTLGHLFNFLGFDSHLANLFRGVLDTRDLVYFLSLTGVFLFASHLQLKSRRWR